MDELGVRLTQLENQLEQQVETEHVLREEHAETQRQLQRAKEKALRRLFPRGHGAAPTDEQLPINEK